MSQDMSHDSDAGLYSAGSALTVALVTVTMGSGSAVLLQSPFTPIVFWFFFKHLININTGFLFSHFSKVEKVELSARC